MLEMQGRKEAKERKKLQLHLTQHR